MWQTIRKFGLECCDLPTMLWNVTTMLRWIALDADPRNKPASILFYIFLIFVGVCYYYVYLVSMVWFVFWRCRQTGDLFSAIIVLSLGASSEISMTKFLCLLVQRRSVRKLVTEFLETDAQVIPDSRFHANLKPTLRAVKKRAIIVWNVIMWNGIIYIVMALCKPGRHFMEDVFEFYGFENMAEMKTSPKYEFIFSINMVGVFSTCFPAANVTAFFIILAGYIEAQMLALSVELTNLWGDAIKYCDTGAKSHIRDTTTNSSITREFKEALSSITDDSGDTSYINNTVSDRVTDSYKTLSQRRNFNGHFDSDAMINITKESQNKSFNSYDRKKINEYIRKRLVDIIAIHTVNINLLHKIEAIFKIAIALEFMLLIIGLIAELLGGLEKTYIQVPFALMSVGIDCLTGQRIKDAGMTFEKAVYDSKWENFDISNRKMIMLMLRSSQKVLKLSAGGIATLTLECLMAVLKSTYSAYTTLRSTMK